MRRASWISGAAPLRDIDPQTHVHAGSAPAAVVDVAAWLAAAVLVVRELAGVAARLAAAPLAVATAGGPTARRQLAGGRRGAGADGDRANSYDSKGLEPISSPSLVFRVLRSCSASFQASP